MAGSRFTSLDTDDTNYLNFSAGATATEYKYPGTPYMNKWTTVRMNVVGNQISFYADGALKETFTLRANTGYRLALSAGSISWKSGANTTSFGQINGSLN